MTAERDELQSLDRLRIGDDRDIDPALLKVVQQPGTGPNGELKLELRMFGSKVA
jgi:hypothetical protein